MVVELYGGCDVINRTPSLLTYLYTHGQSAVSKNLHVAH